MQLLNEPLIYIYLKNGSLLESNLQHDPHCPWFRDLSHSD